MGITNRRPSSSTQDIKFMSGGASNPSKNMGVSSASVNINMTGNSKLKHSTSHSVFGGSTVSSSLFYQSTQKLSPKVRIKEEGFESLPEDFTPIDDKDKQENAD